MLQIEIANREIELAEGVGFEPTRACALPVFKTGAINRSTTPPGSAVARNCAIAATLSKVDRALSPLDARKYAPPAPYLASPDGAADTPDARTASYVHVNLTMAVRQKKTKKKFVPIVEEAPPPSPAIHGRGASWNPANRFEKLHVDLGDVDVVQIDPTAEEERSRGARRNFFATGRRRSSRGTTARMSVSRRASIRIAVASTAAFTASRGRRTNISAFPPGSISRAGSW